MAHAQRASAFYVEDMILLLLWVIVGHGEVKGKASGWQCVQKRK